MSEHSGPRQPTRREILRAMGYGTGALLAGPALAACGGGGDGGTGAAGDATQAAGQSGGQQPSSNAAANLEMWTFANTHARWFRSMAEDYAKENPGFSLKVTEIAFDEMHEKLLVALQSGGVGAPDIADIEQGPFGGFLKGGQPALVDLSDRLKQGNHLENLVEAREALYTYQGKIYGIEHALTPVVLYYRGDLWEKVGVDPSEFKTWDDYVAGAKEVAQGKVKAMPFPTHDVLLRQRGSDYFNKAGEVTLDSEQSIDTANWILALRDEHGIADQPTDGDVFNPAWFAALKQGRWASIVGADWYAGSLKDNAPDLEGKWKAAPLPAWENGGTRTSCWGGTGSCIVGTSKNQEAAWKFMEYTMLSVDGNARRYLETKLWPPLKPAWEDQRLQSKDKYFSEQNLGELFGELGASVPAQYQSPYRAQLNTELGTAWEGIYQGKQKPEQVFKKIADSIRKTIQQEQG